MGAVSPALTQLPGTPRQSQQQVAHHKEFHVFTIRKVQNALGAGPYPDEQKAADFALQEDWPLPGLPGVWC